MANDGVSEAFLVVDVDGLATCVCVQLGEMLR